MYLWSNICNIHGELLIFQDIQVTKLTGIIWPHLSVNWMLPFPPNELIACKSFVSRRIVWHLNCTATICTRETSLIRTDRRIIHDEKSRHFSSSCDSWPLAFFIRGRKWHAFFLLSFWVGILAHCELWMAPVPSRSHKVED